MGDPEEAMQAFRELQQLDDIFCHHGKSLVNNMIIRQIGLKHEKALEYGNVYLAGSLVEGAAMARIFEENSYFNDNLNREAEVDINYNLLEIPEERKHLIQDVPDKIGYANVEVDLDLARSSRKLGWVMSDNELNEGIIKMTSKSGLLKPNKIKQVTRERVAVRNLSLRVDLITSAALDVPKADVELTEFTEEMTGASVVAKFLVNIQNKPYLAIAFDTATLIRLPWWPSIGNEWKGRQRNWPSQEKIDEMSSICYLIGKPVDSHDLESTESRYSFGHIERELVSMRSKHQNLVYLLFKAMFYKWIKPINPDKISSFIAKTIMFWTCEEFPPNHEMWSEDFTTLIETLSYLFNKMQKSFENGFLKFFFIKEIDVITRVPSADKRRVSEKCKEILGNIKEHLIFPMEKELEAAREIMNGIKSSADIIEEMKRKDFSRIFRQPQLLQDILEEVASSGKPLDEVFKFPK